METEFDRILNEIEAAIVEASKHLVVQNQQEALTKLREQAGNWRAIQDNVASIRAEIITPVNRSLTTGNRLGLAGIIVGAVGAVLSTWLFYLSNPFGTAKDIRSIESHVQRVDANIRSALAQSTLRPTNADFAPIEGEIEIYGRGEILKGAQSINLELERVYEDEIEGIRTLVATMSVYSGKNRVAGKLLEEVTSVEGRGSIYQHTSNAISATPGDTIVIYGHRFEVTRVLSTSPFSRNLGDEKVAVYLVAKE